MVIFAMLLCYWTSRRELVGNSVNHEDAFGRR